MMTGQILGGSPVTEAAHYQILIMYLIATCLFCALFTNVFILHRVAFDVGAHVLRIDRFVEIIDEKQNKNHNVGIAENFIKRLQNCCCGMWGRQQHVLDAAVGNDLETQQLNYGSGNSVPTNRITVLTRQFSSDGSVPFFRIESLSFSVPKSHSKKRRNINADAGSSSLQPSHPQAQHRVLCTDLNASLNQGEIGIVKGSSGSGKSTLLRVLSGLTPMDNGDVFFSGMSLHGCSNNRDGFGHNMVQWRTNVRYVTQYKVDLPGTPRDFVSRVASFYSHSKFDSPPENEMISQTSSYLQSWGMGESEYGDDHGHQHPLDREWKTLSGGESQRMILAIAMASRGRILLLDEATSGLDNEIQKRVEESVVDYVKTNGAAVLWVTHSEDIAERLLEP
jgi:ABC-type multidrug transport system ATPase subunit